MFSGYFADVSLYPDSSITEAYDLAILVEDQTIACWPPSKRDAALYYLTAHYLFMFIIPESESSFNPLDVSVGVAETASIGTISVSKRNTVTASMTVVDQDYTKTQFGKLYLLIKNSIKPNVLKVINKKSCGC